MSFNTVVNLDAFSPSFWLIGISCFMWGTAQLIHAFAHRRLVVFQTPRTIKPKRDLKIYSVENQ